MISFVDKLCKISKERVRAEFLIGQRTMSALRSYSMGFLQGCAANGLKDTRYDEFVDWLRKRGESNSLGWAELALRRHDRDEERALFAFLDRVDEFVRENPLPPT